MLLKKLWYDKLRFMKKKLKWSEEEMQKCKAENLRNYERTKPKNIKNRMEFFSTKMKE